MNRASHAKEGTYIKNSDGRLGPQLHERLVELRADFRQKRAQNVHYSLIQA